MGPVGIRDVAVFYRGPHAKVEDEDNLENMIRRTDSWDYDSTHPHPMYICIYIRAKRLYGSGTSAVHDCFLKVGAFSLTIK